MRIPMLYIYNKINEIMISCHYMQLIMYGVDHTTINNI